MDDRFDHVYRKSSRSRPTQGDCVEVADLHGAHAVRDTRHRGLGALVFGSAEWAALLAVTRAIPPACRPGCPMGDTPVRSCPLRANSARFPGISLGEAALTAAARTRSCGAEQRTRPDGGGAPGGPAGRP